MMTTNNNEKSELDQESSYLSEREVDPMDHTYCSHRGKANKVNLQLKNLLTVRQSQNVLNSTIDRDM